MEEGEVQRKPGGKQVREERGSLSLGEGGLEFCRLRAEQVGSCSFLCCPQGLEHLKPPHHHHEKTALTDP